MAAPDSSVAAQIASVAILGDAVRRRLFEFTRRARGPVTRAEAAAAVGISRKLAAFHLDKLVRAGLLRVEVAPRQGRAPGRRPKVYATAQGDVTVSIPERRTELLAGILLEAVVEHEAGADVAERAARVALDRGTEAGRTARAGAGSLRSARALDLVTGVLDEHGYEPEVGAEERVRLRNCPFHPLAVQAPDFVCGLNEAFVSGLLAGLGVGGMSATPCRHDGECCVEVRTDQPVPDTR